MSKANPYNGSPRTFDRLERHERSRERDRSREQKRDRVLEKRGRSDQQLQKRSVYDVDEHPFQLRHEIKRLNSRLDKIADFLERLDFIDIVENYMNPKKRMITNFTAGLSRGLGMTIGTFVVLGLLGYILSLFVDMPLIGDYIAELQGYINKSK
ncbi:DUF5665 domain-containing protein [Paenibacillus sp. N3/727]|uniref:DUF5665 domain-containing protein n=1 Tax=Paenibacillus sp. N3/727 TaxID=2925845 RepID=UPI001F52FF1B|nr:DUF5665 domain-containing protein [Paenibacillus sp. N3/727]UNK17797.1 DUF5665 domain-containing protein [Paenibacillus sp. N3/727]